MQALYDTNDGYGFVAADKYPFAQSVLTGEGLFRQGLGHDDRAKARCIIGSQHYLIASEIASGDELESKRVERVLIAPVERSHRGGLLLISCQTYR